MTDRTANALGGLSLLWFVVAALGMLPAAMLACVSERVSIAAFVTICYAVPAGAAWVYLIIKMRATLKGEGDV